MAIRAILTSLVLGSSTLAAAHPRFERHERYEQRHHRWEHERREHERWERRSWRERDHRWYAGYVAPPVYGGYVAPPVYAASPFAASGAMVLALDSAACDGIELTTSSSTYVDRVEIEYADGRSEAQSVGRRLDASDPVAELETDGSPIARVVVYGTGAAVSARAV